MHYLITVVTDTKSTQGYIKELTTPYFMIKDRQWITPLYIELQET